VEAVSNGASVVSPEALGAFIATEELVDMPWRALHLQYLGVSDNHCEVMAHELSRDDAVLGPIDDIDWTGKPSIEGLTLVLYIGTNRTGRRILTC
jgi:hypothetical protein